MAPPKGNVNALKHGLRAQDRNGLTVGVLPQKCNHIARQLSAFRRALEARVLSERDECTVIDQVYIVTATRLERHCLLAGRWLKESYDSLDTEQRLRMSGEIIRASEARDRAVAKLRLTEPTSDPFATVDDEDDVDPAAGGGNKEFEAATTSPDAFDDSAAVWGEIDR